MACTSEDPLLRKSGGLKAKKQLIRSAGLLVRNQRANLSEIQRPIILKTSVPVSQEIIRPNSQKIMGPMSQMNRGPISQKIKPFFLRIRKRISQKT